MAEDVEVMTKDKASNACCAALNKKHTKLLEKYSKLEDLKNKFRTCTVLIQEKYDGIEKENEYLKTALEELKVQANLWQAEKDTECGRCVDLDDEVSALKEEIQSLKQNHNNSASQEADEKIQERRNVSGKEIKHLKELLDKEKKNAALEKKKAESEKKKIIETLKKVEAENKKVTEAVNAEKKKADENRILCGNFKTETDLLKSMLASERSKNHNNSASQEADEKIRERLCAAEKETKHLKELLDKEKENAALEKKIAESEKKKVIEALKKVEAEDKKVTEAQKAVDAEKKKADENRILWEKLKTETDVLKSMLDSERSKNHNNSASQEADEKIRERLYVAEKEIKHLKELLDKEKENAALEKKIAESEKKKVIEALKKVEAEEKKVTEVQKAVFAEKKKADENRILWEKLKMETDALKTKLASERSKNHNNSASQEAVEKIREHLNVAEKEIKHLKELLDKEKENAALEKKNAESEKKKVLEALKKVEVENKKVTEAQKAAKAEKKKADENRILWEKLKMETNRVKSLLASEKLKVDDADKKIEAEKQKAVTERKRADSVEAKSEELRRLAEKNLKKAGLEKERADDLNRKLEEARVRLMKLEELQKRLCYEKIAVEAEASIPRTGKCAEFPNDFQLSKALLEKDYIISMEKKRADSEKKKAKKQKKVAEEQKMLVVEQKHRADRLSNELESNKLKVNELQKELQEFVSHRIYADIAPLRNNEVISEADTVKLLKKRLKLEKMLVKHANGTAKVEALRNNMLHLELGRLKQEYSWFQQRLDLLDKSFLPVLEGNKLKKIDNQATTKETLSSGENHRALVSGTDSGLDPSNQKMLQSCAINNSSASFSDRILLGSQESHTSSLTATDKRVEDISNLKPTTILKLSDKTVKTVVEADNIMRSNEKRVGYSGTKRTLEAVEPKENLYPMRVFEKLSLLQSEMNEQKVEQGDTLKEKSGRKHIRPPKRRKTSREGMIGIHHSDARVGASSFGVVDVIKSGSSMKNGTDDKFDEMAANDYMKLLDLDVAADESSYCRAIAKPLSPLFPEVEIHRDEVDNPKMLAHKSSQKGSSNVKSVGSVSESDTFFNQHVSGGRLAVSDLSGSVSKEPSTTLSERGRAFTDGCHLMYFVLPLDKKDNSSISRFLQTMDTCKPQCSFFQSTEIFFRSVIHALSKTEDLSTKEKACVFFSLVLYGISKVGIKNSTDFSNDKLVMSFDAVMHHIHSAFSDPVLRRILMESCDLLELFAVVENFILQRKVFVLGEKSSEPEDITHCFKANVVLNGKSITVSEVVASSELLVAGGSLLASLCSAFDQIGFVCEMSCNIITMQKPDTAVMLAVLHAFAHVSGSKYFTLEHYALAMTVVKSLVVFLEKQTSSRSEKQSKSWRCCTNCPFSEGVLSVEDVAALLLENLRKLGQSKCWPLKRLVPRGESEEVSGSREASVLLSFASDEKLCDFADVLSLVETLASFMSWDWTFDHIISELCEYMESHLMEGFSAAIVVLLGQLGRLGVGASGYEDARVKQLRGRFTAILCDTTFVKLDFSVQFAVITSLFGLSPIKYEEIVEGEVETSAAMSQSIVPASFIRGWFSQLSFEQQSLFRHHQAGNEEQ